jgi:hypothetical protein
MGSRSDGPVPGGQVTTTGYSVPHNALFRALLTDPGLRQVAPVTSEASLPDTSAGVRTRRCLERNR